MENDISRAYAENCELVDRGVFSELESLFPCAVASWSMLECQRMDARNDIAALEADLADCKVELDRARDRVRDILGDIRDQLLQVAEQVKAWNAAAYKTPLDVVTLLMRIESYAAKMDDRQRLTDRAAGWPSWLGRAGRNLIKLVAII